MDEDFLREIFSSVEPVSIRRLFGGQGIYADGLIVAVVFRDQLFLKGDAETAPAFEAAGSTRWQYTREGGTPTAMPYWSAPSAMLDDPEEAERWCAVAGDAARRSQRKSAPPRKSKSKARPSK